MRWALAWLLFGVAICFEAPYLWSRGRLPGFFKAHQAFFIWSDIVQGDGPGPWTVVGEH